MSDWTPEQLAELGRWRALGPMLAGFIHQLRTPLAVVQSSVEDLRTLKKMPKEAADRLNMMQRSVDRMQSAVQTLLSFARGDEGPLQDGSVNIVLERVCDFLTEECPKRGVRLEKTFDSRLPPVPLRAAHLEEALINLVVNAMDAMPHGGTLSLSSRSASDGSVVITVKDEGQGMTAEQLASLGRAFQTSKTQGLGLGVFLTRKIVDAHHAQLQYASEPGKGTIATLTFPPRTQALAA